MDSLVCRKQFSMYAQKAEEQIWVISEMHNKSMAI